MNFPLCAMFYTRRRFRETRWDGRTDGHLVIVCVCACVRACLLACVLIFITWIGIWSVCLSRLTRDILNFNMLTRIVSLQSLMPRSACPYTYLMYYVWLGMSEFVNPIQKANITLMQLWAVTIASDLQWSQVTTFPSRRPCVLIS
jgi:hypothetical protein